MNSTQKMQKKNKMFNTTDVNFERVSYNIVMRQKIKCNQITAVHIKH